MSASPSRAAIDPQVIAAGSPEAAATKPASKAKPAIKSKAPSSRSKTAAAAPKKPVSATKKPASTTTKKAAAPKKASLPKVCNRGVSSRVHLTNLEARLQAAPTESKFSMEDMIKDAIKNDKENVRGGVSRPAIKK